MVNIYICHVNSMFGVIEMTSEIQCPLCGYIGIYGNKGSDPRFFLIYDDKIVL